MLACMLYVVFQNLYDKARIYFERAKDFDYQALYMLACMLYVVFQNLYDKARIYFWEGQGLWLPSVVHVGLYFVFQNLYDKARIYFERAKDFDYQALYMLACMLYDGEGCKEPEPVSIYSFFI